MVLLKHIFILALFLIPLGEIIRIDLGNTVILKPLDIAVGLIVILWLIYKIRKREIIKQKYVGIPVLFFTSIGTFSLLINSYQIPAGQLFVSLLYLVRWIAYAGIFFVVSDFDKEFKKRIAGLLVIVGALVIGLGYIQYFLYGSLKELFHLGWDEHMYRMFSVFLDPNFAGAFFILFFLFVANLFLKKKNTLLRFILALTLGAIFLTFSRSALIMLIVSSTILFYFMKKKTLILLMFGIIILVSVISSNFYNIENINLFRTISSKARIETAGNAVRIIQDNPILGVGFNAYKYAQIKHGFRLEENTAKSHADAGVDNSLLFIIATTGVIGFTAYLFIWYRVLKQYKFSALIISFVFGIFVNSLFLNSLFYPPIMLWIWIVLGVTEKN